MDRKLEVGSSIIFVDAKAVRHNALVTIVWDQVAEYAGRWEKDAEGKDVWKQVSAWPGCNLVFISGDPERKDSCGRQMERQTSVIHKTMQPAHGMYWCWPDE
jgi:hypothetical protein